MCEACGPGTGVWPPVTGESVQPRRPSAGSGHAAAGAWPTPVPVPVATSRSQSLCLGGECEFRCYVAISDAQCESSVDCVGWEGTVVPRQTVHLERDMNLGRSGVTPVSLPEGLYTLFLQPTVP